MSSLPNVGKSIDKGERRENISFIPSRAYANHAADKRAFTPRDDYILMLLAPKLWTRHRNLSKETTPLIINNDPVRVNARYISSRNAARCVDSSPANVARSPRGSHNDADLHSLYIILIFMRISSLIIYDVVTRIHINAIRRASDS